MVPQSPVHQQEWPNLCENGSYTMKTLGAFLYDRLTIMLTLPHPKKRLSDIHFATGSSNLDHKSFGRRNRFNATHVSGKLRDIFFVSIQRRSLFCYPIRIRSGMLYCFLCTRA